MNYINRGASLIATNPAESIKLIKKGIEVWPKDPIGWYNLGLAYHACKKIEESIKAYRLAIELNNGEFNEAINNIAQDLLLNGEWKEGWKFYEHRLKTMRKKYALYQELYGRPWEGYNENREFDELLIVAEQGFGDTIQFIRFAPELNKKGIKYSIFCQEKLAGLLRSSKFLENIKTSLIGDKRKILWCPLLSLPGKLGITRKTIVKANGYIKPSDKHIKKWQSILKPRKGETLIGLHWQGNKDFEKKIYSKGRSMPYRYFKELNKLKGIKFIALQKGISLNDINEDIGLQYAEGQEELNKSMCFEDTAAAIKCCDFVITTDNSIAHLTGAMGVECLLLLSWIPEWRWGLRGNKTEWYESVTLFRQDKRDDWSGVIEKARIHIQNKK